MSMYTVMSGEFEIDPPLSHQELRRYEQLGFSEIEVTILTDEVETEDGTLIKRRGTVVTPVYEDQHASNYKVAGELQQLFHTFVNPTDPTPRSFNGSISCVYEEAGDVVFMTPLNGVGSVDGRVVPTIDGIWRYEESGGRLVTKYPVISTWSEKEPTS